MSYELFVWTIARSEDRALSPSFSADVTDVSAAIQVPRLGRKSKDSFLFFPSSKEGGDSSDGHRMKDDLGNGYFY